MRTLVVGAGALGSVFGCMLGAAGHEIGLLEPGPRLDDVRRRGLRVSGLFGERQCRELDLYSSADELPASGHDLVLVAVKSFDTGNAVRGIRSRIGKDALVLSLQNGLGNVEAIRDALGEKRALAGRVIFGAQFVEPAHVKVTVYAEPVMIGSPTNTVEMPRLKRIAGEFSAAGIPTEPTYEIGKFIWAKVLYNCALNPLSALLQVPYGRLLESESTRSLMRHIVEEAFTVAQAHEIELFWHKPREYIDVLFGRSIPDTAAHYASMAQDLKAGRRTEIDALNGAVVALGTAKRVECPVNGALTELVRAAESLVVRR